MYQENEDSQKQNQVEVQQQLPDYGEVEGQRIYMKGLDYSLLQKQKQQDHKISFLGNMKSQLEKMQKKIDSRSIKVQQKNTQLDQQSKKLIISIKLIQNTKPLINNSTFYIFDTRFHFGALKPQIITKRQGRMNKQSGYIKVNEQTLAKFKRILQKPKTDSQMLNKQKALKKLLQKDESSSSDSSEDNIFGSDQDDQKEELGDKPVGLFNFGKKLNLGVKDQDIFYKKPQPLKIQKDKFNEQVQLIQSEPVKDKYEFLRKKVKKNTTELQTEGYGQCYFQTGPTFQELKQSRNNGIQIFGDLKEWKSSKVDKKPNIGRQYDKVKKIIDSKYSKK